MQLIPSFLQLSDGYKERLCLSIFGKMKQFLWSQETLLRARGTKGLLPTTLCSDFPVAASDVTGLQHQHNPFVHSVWFKRLIFLPLSHSTANLSWDIELLLIIPLVKGISWASCHCLSKRWINISMSYCEFPGFPTSLGNWKLLVENTKFESVRKVTFNPCKKISLCNTVHL